MKKKLTALTAALFAVSMIGVASAPIASAQSTMTPPKKTAAKKPTTPPKTTAAKKPPAKTTAKKPA
jgi:hypothetical protein